MSDIFDISIIIDFFFADFCLWIRNKVTHDNESQQSENNIFHNK